MQKARQNTSKYVKSLQICKSSFQSAVAAVALVWSNQDKDIENSQQKEI